MYKCVSCGSTFTESDFGIATFGLDSPAYERKGVCPYCGSENYDDFYEEEE